MYVLVFQGEEWAALSPDKQWCSCFTEKYQQIYMKAKGWAYTKCLTSFYELSFPVWRDSSCSQALILISCTAAGRLRCNDGALVSWPLAPAVIHRHSAGHTLTTWLIWPIHLSSSHTVKESGSAITYGGDAVIEVTSVMCVQHVTLLVWFVA